MGFWVAARTKAQRERWAAENVVRQGGSYYLPRLVPTKPPLPGKAPVPPCMFPSYLFVHTDGHWRYLLGTFGIAGVVMQGGQPARLPEIAIERIKAQEDSDGLVRLPNAPEARFQPGEAIRVKDGVFSGYRGIYQDDAAQDRVRILLEYLGAKRTVLIGEHQLEAAS